MNADELWRFLRRHASREYGRLVSRASIVEELRRQRVPRPAVVRRRLVTELERRGWIRRLSPPAGPLELVRLDLRAPIPPRGAVELGSDPDATRRRIRALRRYMSRNVLADDAFVCAKVRDCKRSIPPGGSFMEGQLSHVGKHYDVERGGRPLRIVVVGQEVGARGLPHITMRQRYHNVHDWVGLGLRFYKDGPHPGRNPHMRGTTLALRILLGLGVGTDYRREFVELEDGPAHIFDCFALVNRLLCAAHVRNPSGTRTSQGQARGTMYRNCEPHFEATLRILDPTIVILQGVTVRNRTTVLPVSRQISDHLLECDGPNGPVLVCAFSHPSARGQHRWDSPAAPYFKEVVKPTLRKAIRRMDREGRWSS